MYFFFVYAFLSLCVKFIYEAAFYGFTYQIFVSCFIHSFISLLKTSGLAFHIQVTGMILLSCHLPSLNLTLNQTSHAAKRINLM